MSRLPFELFLALRYLRPKRTFVSIITLISIVGVALGVAVLVIVMSVMSGFDHDLREKILGFNSHLTVFQRGSTMKDYPQVMDLISSNKNVVAVAPAVMGQVLLETQPTNGAQSQVFAPWVRGVDPQREGSVSHIPQSVVMGEFDLGGRGILLGSTMADNLGVNVGDRVAIYSPAELKKMKDRRGKADETAVLPDDYEVRGIFSVGYNDFDSAIAIVSLENAQDLYLLDDSVHDVLVMVRDPYAAGRVKEELEETLGPKFGIETWMEHNSAILNALIVEKNVMFYLLFFIVLVAALCILSAQITFVMQKTREIGMLKALGATKLQISGIFLVQSAVIGVIGVLAGYGLAMLAIEYRNEFLHVMNRLTGFELFPASVYGFGQLPALIIPRDVVLVCVSSFIICILGGVLPAIRAGRLKPVEALRYE